MLHIYIKKLRDVSFKNFELYLFKNHVIYLY